LGQPSAQTVVDGFIAYGYTTTYSVFSAFCVRLPFPHTKLCRLLLANNYRMRTYVFYLLISSDDVTTDNRVLRMMWRTLLKNNLALLFWLLTCRGLNKHLNRKQLIRTLSSGQWVYR